MLFLKNPVFLRICNWQTHQAKSNNSSKYHSMAALFRPFLTLLSASNPCSKSAIKVVRTCPLKKIFCQSAVFETCHLWRFYGGSCMERIPVGHLQFWALSSISCCCDPICCSSCLAHRPSLFFESFSCSLRVWEEDLAGYNIMQFSEISTPAFWIWISTLSSCVFLQRSSSVMIYGHFTLKAYM